MAMSFDQATKALTDSDVWIDVSMVSDGYVSKHYTKRAKLTI